MSLSGARSRLLAVLLALPMVAVLLTFASPAHAIAENWGFAYVHTPNPALGCTLDVNRQALSSGACVKVTFAAGGHYELNFQGLGAASKDNGIVHVMAVDTKGHWCQARAWVPVGADILIRVDCYEPGGALSPTQFSVTYMESLQRTGGPEHAYVHSKASGGIIREYNSSGVGNSVSPGGVGEWKVYLPNMGGGKYYGNAQATAVDWVQGARCKIAAWDPVGSGQVFIVHCYDSFGNPYDTEFTLSYHFKRAVYGAIAPPKHFAYFWDVGAPPPGTIFNSQGGANSVMSAGLGLRLFQFKLVGLHPSHVMVTSFGWGNEYCGMIYPWQVGGGTAILRDVVCYDAAGNPTPMTDSFVTYTSAW